METPYANRAGSFCLQTLPSHDLFTTRHDAGIFFNTCVTEEWRLSKLSYSPRHSAGIFFNTRAADEVVTVIVACYFVH